MAKPTKTPVMVLQELTVKKGSRPPEYEIVFSKSGTHENRFDYVVSAFNIQAKGTGSSKQISKHQAAHNALMKLKDLGLYNPAENPVTEFNVPLQQNVPPDSPFKPALNCIGHLKDLCAENKIPAPVFTEISDIGPPHAKEFTYECKIASIRTEAKGTTKKIAKQIAAKEMLDRIKDVIPDLACQMDAGNAVNKLMELDNDALVRYSDFADVIPNKSVKIGEMDYILKRLMEERNLTFRDFREEFLKRDQDALQKILTKLELTSEFYHMQDDPALVVLSLSTDTPFVIIGIARDVQAATYDALQKAFQIMEAFME